MAIVLDGTSGITNDSGYTGDGVSFADSTPANTLVTTTGGNVGVGTSSPTGISGRKTQVIRGTTSELLLQSSSATESTSDGITVTAAGSEAYYVNRLAGAHIWTSGSGGNTERARIDSSGVLLVGKTSDDVSAVGSSMNGEGRINLSRTGTASSTQVGFYRNGSGTAVGAITTTSTATTYSTSSDYRLKHDIQPMTGALARVASLKPCTYKWNADNSQSQGFIAHELQEVVPECVTGEKDAVDADGNPQYQGIDTSFLAATMVAAIQELKGINDAQAQIITALTARVEAQEVRLTSLEGAQA
jgi:hypothetical protein